MSGNVHVFDASLVGYRGVTRRIAVLGGQTLVDLSAALQQAFGWWEEHLYSFWLDGEFWGGPECEYACPLALEPPARSAEATLDALDLETGQKIAYVFDYGDEWRVRLTVKQIGTAAGGAYPQLLASRGQAPPQYLYEEESA